MKVDIGFWDINGNYIEDIQEINEMEIKNESEAIFKLSEEIYNLKAENAELRSALQEIKEIAEKYDNLTYPVSSIVLSHEILQKITKAEEE